MAEVDKIIIGVIVFLAISALGFITGGSHRKMRKEEEAAAAREREAKERDKERDEKQRQERIKARREQLIRMRNWHLEEERERNTRYMEDNNIPMSNITTKWEREAMLKYDKEHYEDWKEVGMIPPSYRKDVRNDSMLKYAE